MNRYKKDDAFGKEAVDALMRKFPGHYEYITDEEEQRTCGDLREIGTGRYIEVKHDRHKPRNFYFEEFSDWENGSPGWVHNLTNCDTLIYKFQQNKNFFVMPFFEVRKVCKLCRAKHLPYRFQPASFPSKAWGWLVPGGRMKGVPGWRIL